MCATRLTGSTSARINDDGNLVLFDKDGHEMGQVGADSTGGFGYTGSQSQSDGFPTIFAMQSDTGSSGSGGTSASSDTSNDPSKPMTDLDYLLQDYKKCLGVAGATIANDLNPYSIGVGTTADITGAMSQANFDAAAGWSMQQGLTVPLRSSIVRGALSQAETLGKASGVLALIALDYALVDGLVAEAKACF